GDRHEHGVRRPRRASSAGGPGRLADDRRCRPDAAAVAGLVPPGRRDGTRLQSAEHAQDPQHRPATPGQPVVQQHAVRRRRRRSHRGRLARFRRSGRRRAAGVHRQVRRRLGESRDEPGGVRAGVFGRHPRPPDQAARFL
ncbi:MAG: hypothetical protein AVDCRST_MAG59-4948, partial [uncultured Thermomicrobiales bacterium]